MGGAGVLQLAAVGALRGRVGRAPGEASATFKTWNEFQAGTKGRFATRTEAAKAWKYYKESNGIKTGTIRSKAARTQFLKSLAEHKNTPSHLKQWLREGRVPPGYNVDHIKPLSVGGADTPANMRLQVEVQHIRHHQIYSPWRITK